MSLVCFILVFKGRYNLYSLVCHWHAGLTRVGKIKAFCRESTGYIEFAMKNALYFILKWFATQSFMPIKCIIDTRLHFPPLESCLWNMCQHAVPLSRPASSLCSIIFVLMQNFRPLVHINWLDPGSPDRSRTKGAGWTEKSPQSRL